MSRIRPIRSKLRELKNSRAITKSIYRKLYDMAESGVFESKTDLERYIKAHDLWRRR
jgi:large subunit ribosomal protein L19e